MKRDVGAVAEVLDLLAEHGVYAWVFGGWAEQLLGLDAPRVHQDVDLLYPAQSFDAADGLELAWIPAKSFAHTRAFHHGALLVELFLVQWDRRGYYTDLPYGRHRWPADVLSEIHGLRVASPAAVSGFRATYTQLHAA